MALRVYILYGNTWPYTYKYTQVLWDTFSELMDELLKNLGDPDMLLENVTLIASFLCACGETHIKRKNWMHAYYY